MTSPFIKGMFKSTIINLYGSLQHVLSLASNCSSPSIPFPASSVLMLLESYSKIKFTARMLNELSSITKIWLHSEHLFLNYVFVFYLENGCYTKRAELFFLIEKKALLSCRISLHNYCWILLLAVYDSREKSSDIIGLLKYNWSSNSSSKFPLIFSSWTLN
jgi:hypothetical protein